MLCIGRFNFFINCNFSAVLNSLYPSLHVYIGLCKSYDLLIFCLPLDQDPLHAFLVSSNRNSHFHFPFLFSHTPTIVISVPETIGPKRLKSFLADCVQHPQICYLFVFNIHTSLNTALHDVRSSNQLCIIQLCFL